MAKKLTPFPFILGLLTTRRCLNARYDDDRVPNKRTYF